MTRGIVGITNGIMWDSFLICFECSTARNLTYSVPCEQLVSQLLAGYYKVAFISSLHKVCCECTRACIEETIYRTNSSQS